jgi:Peptidase family M49
MHESASPGFRRFRGFRGFGFVGFFAVVVAACQPAPVRPAEAPAPAGSALDTKIRRFAPVEISANTASLPQNERDALAKLVDAARLMDGLFLEQVWAGNLSLLTALAGDRTPEGAAELHYFLINKGPWSRIDHDEMFLRPSSRVPAKPAQANFYPGDATKDEVDKWFKSLSGPAQAAAKGFFSVIRRAPDRTLTAVPYSVAYQNTLVQAASLLREAATLTSQPTLQKYLNLRAASFLTDDYYASDVAWMELDASIEPTIGPYETYEDGWFEYKAAFEAFITVRDDAETKKLGAFGAELQGLENALPIDAAIRNPKLGALAPIRVVNVVFAAGDGNRGVQTAAFNLPNDERVIKEKGSKRVMLKNVQEAKFLKVLQPIAGVALAAADRSKVSFDAFFTHILMHELMHGLGPHHLGRGTETVRSALQDTYSAIEEAKADISGLWALQQLADKGVISAEVARTMYTTFLASIFRSIRFGITEAHGKGIALQLNYLLDRGAIAVAADGTFSIVDAKIKDAVAALTHDLMTLQSEGNYEKAQDLLKKMVVVRPEVQQVLDKLKDVPVDIEPRFTGAR